MLKDIIMVTGKILGSAGGVALIALALMGFGIIPLTALAFGAAVSFWQIMILLAMLIVTIALIIEGIIK